MSSLFGIEQVFPIAKLDTVAWVGMAAVVVSVAIAILTLDRSRTPSRVQLLVVALMVLGGALSVYCVGLDSAGKADASDTAAAEANTIVAQSNALGRIERVTGATNDAVGDLDRLNSLAPSGARFFVAVSHSSAPKLLQACVDNIRRDLQIVGRSDQVCVVGTPADGYDLMAGRGLNLSAAEVIKTLSDSNQWGPPSEPARIRPDRGVACLSPPPDTQGVVCR